jgi:hypothetical protein
VIVRAQVDLDEKGRSGHVRGEWSPQPRVTQSHSIFNSNKQYISGHKLTWMRKGEVGSSSSSTKTERMLMPMSAVVTLMPYLYWKRPGLGFRV